MKKRHAIPSELLLQAILTPTRVRHRWHNRNRPQISGNLQNSLRRLFEDAERANLKSYKTLYNAGIFLAILDQDLAGFSESILFSRNQWFRQFHARRLAILLYEASEDIPQVYGKDYRAALKEIEVGTDKIGEISKRVSTFFKKNKVFLGDIRNAVGAHHEHNAIAQMDIMSKLDPLAVYGLAADFAAILKDLLDFNIGLVKYMDNIAVKIRTISKHLSENPHLEEEET